MARDPILYELRGSGPSFATFRDGQRITPWRERNSAECDALAAENRARETIRPCLLCRAEFASTGPHHRMCNTCRADPLRGTNPHRDWRDRARKAKLMQDKPPPAPAADRPPLPEDPLFRPLSARDMPARAMLNKAGKPMTPQFALHAQRQSAHANLRRVRKGAK